MERKMRIKDKSSISPAECITEHLLYIFIVFLNYKTFAFIPLNGYTVSKSRLLLISLYALLLPIYGSRQQSICEYNGIVI